MTTLRALEAHFTKFYWTTEHPTQTAGSGQKRESYAPSNSLAEADGIWFLCPLCFKTNNGPVGTHQIRIGFRGIAEPGTYGYNKKGEPVLWKMSGTGLDDLVLSPSIQLEGGCNWHGFVGSNGVPPGEAA